MTCSAPNCHRKIYCKGYCTKHYWQYKTHGRISKSTRKDFNVVIDKGTHLELILTNIKNLPVGRAKIDKEDLNKLKNVGRWQLNADGYVLNRSNNKILLMHRVIMDALSSEQIDHRKTGFKARSDNRKQNLRKCTNSQNQCNIGLKKNNTSGFKGVSRKRDKWRAEICIKGIKINLGTFTQPEEAYKAYTKASKLYHGEFSNVGKENLFKLKLNKKSPSKVWKGRL